MMFVGFKKKGNTQKKNREEIRWAIKTLLFRHLSFNYNAYRQIFILGIYVSRAIV